MDSIREKRKALEAFTSGFHEAAHKGEYDPLLSAWEGQLEDHMDGVVSHIQGEFFEDVYILLEKMFIRFEKNKDDIKQEDREMMNLVLHTLELLVDVVVTPAFSNDMKNKKFMGLLFRVFLLLHRNLVKLGDYFGDEAQESVCVLFENFYNSTDKDEKYHEILPLMVSYFLGKSLDKQKYVSKVNSLQDIFQLLDLDDDESLVFEFILRACISKNYLHSAEGLRFLVYAFSSIGETIMKEIHRVFVREMILTKDLEVLEVLSKIYLRSWKMCTDEELKDSLQSHVQNLVYHAVHCRDVSLFKKLNIILNKFNENKKLRGVDDLLYNVYSPIIFRSLKAKNAQVRQNSLIILINTFPLVDNSDRTMNNKLLKRQFGILDDFLEDESEKIRSIVIEGLFKIISLFFELIPVTVSQMFLKKIIYRYSYDSCSIVRSSIMKGLSFMLEFHLCHMLLKRFLTEGLGVSFLVNDSSVFVRRNFFLFLLKVANVRSIKFTSICSIDDIIRRFVVERDPVVKNLITKLLLNSYFNYELRSVLFLNRFLNFVHFYPEASVEFYKLASCYFVPKSKVLKLLKLILQFLENNKGFVPNQITPGGGRQRDEEEFEDKAYRKKRKKNDDNKEGDEQKLKFEEEEEGKVEEGKSFQVNIPLIENVCVIFSMIIEELTKLEDEKRISKKSKSNKKPKKDGFYGTESEILEKMEESSDDDDDEEEGEEEEDGREEKREEEKIIQVFEKILFGGKGDKYMLLVTIYENFAEKEQSNKIGNTIWKIARLFPLSEKYVELGEEKKKKKRKKRKIVDKKKEKKILRRRRREEVMKILYHKAMNRLEDMYVTKLLPYDSSSLMNCLFRWRKGMTVLNIVIQHLLIGRNVKGGMSDAHKEFFKEVLLEGETKKKKKEEEEEASGSQPKKKKRKKNEVLVEEEDSENKDESSSRLKKVEDELTEENAILENIVSLNLINLLFQNEDTRNVLLKKQKQFCSNLEKHLNFVKTEILNFVRANKQEQKQKMDKLMEKEKEKEKKKKKKEEEKEEKKSESGFEFVLDLDDSEKDNLLGSLSLEEEEEEEEDPAKQRRKELVSNYLILKLHVYLKFLIHGIGGKKIRKFSKKIQKLGTKNNVVVKGKKYYDGLINLFGDDTPSRIVDVFDKFFLGELIPMMLRNEEEEEEEEEEGEEEEEEDRKKKKKKGGKGNKWEILDPLIFKSAIIFLNDAIMTGLVRSTQKSQVEMIIRFVLSVLKTQFFGVVQKIKEDLMKLVFGLLSRRWKPEDLPLMIMSQLIIFCNLEDEKQGKISLKMKRTLVKYLQNKGILKDLVRKLLRKCSKEEFERVRRMEEDEFCDDDIPTPDASPQFGYQGVVIGSPSNLLKFLSQHMMKYQVFESVIVSYFEEELDLDNFNMFRNLFQVLPADTEKNYFDPVCKIIKQVEESVREKNQKFHPYASPTREQMEERRLWENDKKLLKNLKILKEKMNTKEDEQEMKDRANLAALFEGLAADEKNASRE